MALDTSELNTIDDFWIALKGAKDETERDAVCQALKDMLPGIVTSTMEFRFVIEFLSDAETKAFIDSIRDSLPGMINRVDESMPMTLAQTFFSILDHLNEAKTEAVLDVMKEHFPSYIKAPEDLGKMLGGEFRCLNNTQIKSILDILGDRLKGIIKSGNDFKMVCENLDEEQRAIIHEHIKGWLPNIITSVEDYVNAIEFLSDTQGIIVINSMKDKLLSFITSVMPLRTMLQGLSEVKQKAILDIMNNNLRKMINSPLDFEVIHPVLTRNNAAPILSLYSENRPDLTAGEIINRFFPREYFNDNALKNICMEIIQGQVDRCIHEINPSYLDSLYSFFSQEPSQEVALYLALKNYLADHEKHPLKSEQIDALKTGKPLKLIKGWLDQGFLQAALGLDESIKTLEQFAATCEMKPDVSLNRP